MLGDDPFDLVVIGGGIVGCAAAYFPEANPLVPLEAIAEASRQRAARGHDGRRAGGQHGRPLVPPAAPAVVRPVSVPP